MSFLLLGLNLMVSYTTLVCLGLALRTVTVKERRRRDSFWDYFESEWYGWNGLGFSTENGWRWWTRPVSKKFVLFLVFALPH